MGSTSGTTANKKFLVRRAMSVIKALLKAKEKTRAIFTAPLWKRTKDELVQQSDLVHG
jgi:hypothetical protein